MLLVFVAEFGDKSQLLALSLGTRHRLIPLMAGAFCAFAATTLLSATLGGVIAVAIPASVIAYISGLVFLGFGILMLWPMIGRSAGASTAPDTLGEPATPQDTTIASTWWRVFALAFVAMFLAEFGDKTMLVSATLAARGNIAMVWIGSTLAMTLAALIGVGLGRYVTRFISERSLKIGSAGLFVFVGIVMILGGIRS